MPFRVRLSYQAQVTSEEELPEYLDRSLEYRDANDTLLESYLEDDLLRKGVCGGEVSATPNDSAWLVFVDYWCPTHPTEEIIAGLTEFTMIQILDGAGENGFDFDIEGTMASISVEDTTPSEIRVDASERPLTPPNLIAMAAKDNDLEALGKLLESHRESIDQLYQGFSALHYAVFNANAQAARMLLEHGADPNVRNIVSATPLSYLASIRGVEDDVAVEIAKELIRVGADKGLTDHLNRTAYDRAMIKGKERLAQLLSQ